MLNGFGVPSVAAPCALTTDVQIANVDQTSNRSMRGLPHEVRPTLSQTARDQKFFFTVTAHWRGAPGSPKRPSDGKPVAVTAAPSWFQ
jgi:hypothetical protein